MKISVAAARFRELANIVARARDKIPEDVQAAVVDMGEDAEQVLAAFAPRDTTRLARGIHSIPGRGTALVTAYAQDPQTGYDYVGVTRFGHRVAFIVPRRPGRVVRTTSGGTRFVRAALRIPGASGPRFFSRVPGYHPDHDWVDDAMPELRANLAERSRELGRTVTTRLEGR